MAEFHGMLPPAAPRPIPRSPRTRPPERQGEQGGAISLMLAEARYHPQPFLPNRISAPSDLLSRYAGADEG